MSEPDGPVLKLTELTRSFGDVKAVDGLSLEVRRGEILGFLGPNGAGLGDVAFELAAILALTGLYFVLGLAVFRRRHLRPR